MKRRGIFVVSSLLEIFVLILVIGVFYVYGSIDKKIEEEKKELESIRRKIEENIKKRKDAEKKEDSILSRIEDLDHQRQSREDFLGVIDRRLHEKDREIERLENEVKGLKADIAVGKKRARERLRRIYKEGRSRSLRVIFSAADYNSLLKRYYYMKWLQKKDLEVIKGYEETLIDFEDKGNQLEQVRSEMWTAKGEVTRVMEEIESNRRQKEGLLTRVRLERSLYDKVISELEEDASSLQSLIKELESRKRRDDRSLGFVSQRGKLDWPIAGEIISYFGRQKHPRFDTYIYKKGLEIRPFHDNKIRAVYRGVVVFSGWFRGYGQLIILDHGDNYFSLYAHVEKVAVSAGDRVREEQIIGEIGDTGLSDGNNLYFEIRHGASPVDPILWLKGKG